MDPKVLWNNHGTRNTIPFFLNMVSKFIRDLNTQGGKKLFNVINIKSKNFLKKFRNYFLFLKLILFLNYF